MGEQIKLNQIKDNTERDIIKLLSENDKFMMGDILMQLKLSYRKGHHYLNSLRAKNWVSNTEQAPYYTLKVDLK